MPNILNFMEQVASSLVLKGGGEVSLAYITAEFAPFSSEQKPDVVLRNKDATGTRAYLIEYSLAPVPEDVTYFRDLLREHKEFVISASEIPCGYAFATCQKVSAEVQTQFWISDGIKLFAEATNPEVLAELIMRWANSYQPTEAHS